MKTTLTNAGKKEIVVPGLGDAIQWGGAEKYAPDQKLGFRGRSRGAFVGGVGRMASYAITTDEPAVDAISGGAWTDTEQKKNVTVVAGASVAYERVFLVGRSGDSASVDAELARFHGAPLGRVAIVPPRRGRLLIADERGKTTTMLGSE